MAAGHIGWQVVGGWRSSWHIHLLFAAPFGCACGVDRLLRVGLVVDGVERDDILE